MAKKSDKTRDTLKRMPKRGTEKVDVEAAKEKAADIARALSNTAVSLKDSAMTAKDDITNKLTELDRMLERSITEYNDAFTQMSDKGMKLYVERCRAADTIALTETLVNSIANRPKSFDADIAEIVTYRSVFTNSCEFADKELRAAREAAGGAGAGLAAGASVAFMAPTAAMWIATTFGTASTGTAISALSGAAATNAALAWLGGGALTTATGGGMAAGKALLAMAGPVGWGIAGAALLGSIVLFSSKRAKLNKQKNEEIEAVKVNTETVREMDAKIFSLLEETEQIHNGLNGICVECLPYFNGDYAAFSEKDKVRLGALVNGAKTLSTLLAKTVE